MKGSMHILFLVPFITCRYKLIYMNQTMSNFKNLCNVNYGTVSNSMTLQNLTIFVRNGDRAPEDGKNLAWGKRMCINCEGNKCSLAHCRNGLLTIRGYKQGHDLSAFIKQQYYHKFENKRIETIKSLAADIGIKENISNKDLSLLNSENLLYNHKLLDLDNPHGALFTADTNRLPEEQTPDIKIKGYYYSNNRSYAFLKSIVESLEFSSLNLHHIKTLNSSKKCTELRNLFLNKHESNKIVPTGEFDRIISSLCNDVPLDCERFDCDLMKMEDFLFQSIQQFEDDITRIREDFHALAIEFAPISKFILDIIKNPGDINIASITGETLISLLAGLNTNNQKLAQLGSAVFIELWKDRAGKEFYAVRYNDTHMEFGYYKEKYVEKAEFIKFLELYASYDSKIEKVCKYKIKGLKNEELLNHKKEQLVNIIEPLIKKLHDNRILNK